MESELAPPLSLWHYLEAEIIVSTTAYLCDYHREQAWNRWVKDFKHGLSQEAKQLITFLCACAWAPSADGQDPTSEFTQAVDNLKQSDVWKITFK